MSEGVPRRNVIQDRFFSAREIKQVLRELGLGIDNAEFNRLWQEGILAPPLVYEAGYIGWTYENMKKVMMKVYTLKGRELEYDSHKIMEHFVAIKELKRYKKEMNEQYYRKGLEAPY